MIKLFVRVMGRTKGNASQGDAR